MRASLEKQNQGRKSLVAWDRNWNKQDGFVGDYEKFDLKRQPFFCNFGNKSDISAFSAVLFTSKYEFEPSSLEKGKNRPLEVAVRGSALACALRGAVDLHLLSVDDASYWR